MEIISCASCAKPQPVDWRPGDVCVHCGALARPESRCPWCTQLVPGRFCRHCGCEQVAPSDYGVARMLFSAGVDRLSLVERLRGLDPAQREVFASRFASQRACVAARVEEARACERWLCTQGAAAALEEVLVRALPVPEHTLWLKPGAAVLPSPAELFATTPLGEVQQLAALAHLRTGAVDREILDFARDLAESDDPLAVEAALLVSGWRAREAHRSDRRSAGEGRRAKLQAALQQPALAQEAAVCLALEWLGDRWRGRQDPEAFEALLPTVREALTSPNPEVRFGAALVLGDDERLGRVLAGRPDEEIREAAWRSLARVQSPLIPGLLLGRDAEARERLLELLPTPLSHSVLAAVLRVVAEAAEASEARAKALRLVQRERFLDLVPESREEIARFVSTRGDVLSAQELLHLLAWAATESNGARTGSSVLRPFVDAATRALCTAPPSTELLANGAFEPWLREVRTEEDHLALERLVTAKATSQRVVEALLIQGSHEREADAAAPGLAVARLLALWERAGMGRARWLPAFAQALRSYRGLRGVDALVPALWARFREHPEERAQIVQALDAFKRELFELRDAEPKEASLDGGDPVRFFELWAKAAPLELRELFDTALERGGEGALLPLVQVAVPEALAVEAQRPRTALLLFALVSQKVCNAFRDEPTHDVLAAVAAVKEAWATFEPALAHPTPETEWEGDFEYLRSHVTDALELIDRDQRERAKRQSEQAERERQRAAEQAEREREAAERLQEAAARKAEADRQAAQVQAERDRLMAERQAADEARERRLADGGASGGPAGIPHLEPDLPAHPVDDEPLGTAPLPTLRDYARFLKQLGAGGDAMLLFQAYGMEPTRWAECANGWQRILMSRQDAMLRFGALLQATWASTV